MRKSEKLLTDNDLFADEIEKRIEAWKSGTCIKCGTKINKSKMSKGHLEIYEQSGICDFCFEGIFSAILPSKSWNGKIKKYQIIINVEPAQIGLDGLPVSEKIIEDEIKDIFKKFVPGEFLIKSIKVIEK